MQHQSPQDDWDVERQKRRADLGQQMKSVRQSFGDTPEDAAQRTGLAVSTIHKTENGRVSLRRDNLVRIARAWDIGMERLFSADHGGTPTTRMTVTRAGQGRIVRSRHFEYEVLCSALVDKKIIPLVTRIGRRAPLSESDPDAHTGEETLFVPSGRVEPVVEHDEPVTLETGDRACFDSTLRRGLRARDDSDTRAFWACTHAHVAG